MLVNFQFGTIRNQKFVRVTHTPLGSSTMIRGTAVPEADASRNHSETIETLSKPITERGHMVLRGLRGPNRLHVMPSLSTADVQNNSLNTRHFRHSARKQVGKELG